MYDTLHVYILTSRVYHQFSSIRSARVLLDGICRRTHPIHPSHHARREFGIRIYRSATAPPLPCKTRPLGGYFLSTGPASDGGQSLYLREQSAASRPREPRYSPRSRPRWSPATRLTHASMRPAATGPNWFESFELDSLSPSIHTCPRGTCVAHPHQMAPSTRAQSGRRAPVLCRSCLSACRPSHPGCRRCAS